MTRSQKTFSRIAFITVVLAFCVVIFGAYVRLTGAGLGCPDWPGCYGQLIAPETTNEQAQQAFPGAKIETGKAWREMLHRYLAGLLGVLVLILAILALKNRKDEEQQLALPLFLVFLIIIQALVGMWTVTLLLRPAIVTLHLLLGMLTLALIFLLALNSRPDAVPSNESVNTNSLKAWVRIAFVVLGIQIALGGWVSANYSALHCGAEIFTCQNQYWPQMEFKGAFQLLGESGVNYEGGKLSNEQGVAVHMLHRLGALVTFLIIGFLVLKIYRHDPVFKTWGHILGLAMLVQVGLGLSNVILILPLPVAVAHNGGAALLLLSLINLNYRVNRRSLNSETR